MLCFGHRGARGHAPENTTASVQRALALGADWVEVDVRLADGTLIVFHDERLERTTNGRGRLADHDLATLRSFDAGAGQRIPTLDEIFEVVDDRAGINVECKDAAAVDALDGFLADRPRERVIVSSFDHDSLRRLAAGGNGHRLAALGAHATTDLVAAATSFGAVAVHPEYSSVDEAFVRHAHGRGLAVHAFTVNEPHHIERLRAIGVDGVFTDYPERVTGTA